MDTKCNDPLPLRTFLPQPCTLPPFLSLFPRESEIHTFPPPPPPSVSLPLPLVQYYNVILIVLCAHDPRIINDFDDGVLDAQPGIGLRQLLATKLRCEVMRVSKKFSGWACVGKRSFRPMRYQDGRAARVSETSSGCALMMVI